jgi:hypothetical protein
VSPCSRCGERPDRRGIGWDEADGRIVVARVVKQPPAPPFNMVEVIPRFAAFLREYHVSEQSVFHISEAGDRGPGAILRPV